MIASRSILSREVKQPYLMKTRIEDFCSITNRFAHCLRMTLRVDSLQTQVWATILTRARYRKLSLPHSPANRILLLMESGYDSPPQRKSFPIFYRSSLNNRA